MSESTRIEIDGDGPGVWVDARDRVIEHYERVLKMHGPTARGMEWKDEASQQLRFEVLCRVGDLENRSVHEVGCGAGHLRDFLAKRGVSARYSGSDLSPRMIEAARRRHPDCDFELRDLLGHVPSEQRYDFVVASGVFNVRLDHSDDEWGRVVRRSLRRMFDQCRIGIAFNLMSDHVDFRRANLYYAPSGELLDFCRSELSRWVAWQHDYPLYEQTFFVYREANGLEGVRDGQR